MSGLLVSRIDPAQLYPKFFARLMPLLDDALSQGLAYWVIEGIRSLARSEQLYAQGRDGHPGPIVTNARAGQSGHNFGIAADLCLDGYVDRGGLQPDWRPAAYEPLRLLAPKHGLVWGGLWVSKALPMGDRPHLNFPGFVTQAELAPLRELLATDGLPACWTYIDAHSPA